MTLPIKAPKPPAAPTPLALFAMLREKAAEKAAEREANPYQQPEVIERQPLTTKRAIMLLIFFPFTIYFLVGTCFLFLLYPIEWLIWGLSDYARLTYISMFEPVYWHRRHVIITLFWPVVWPIMMIINLLILLPLCLIASFLRECWELIEYIIERINPNFQMGTPNVTNPISYVWTSIVGWFR